jgi:hypothetical protein
MAHAAEQIHNHNLDSVTLNYPHPVSRLRVVSHNRTKCKDNGTHDQNYFLSIIPMQVTTHLSDPGWGLDPPRWEPGSPPSMFFTLMVGAPGYPSAPPRAPAVDVC